LNGGVGPYVKILDPYGEKVFDTCCFSHNGTPSLSFGTYTFKILQPVIANGFVETKYPVFNSAGNYTMVATLDNRTVQQYFNVIDDTNMTYPLASANETIYHYHQNPPSYSIVNATFGITVENDIMASKTVEFKVSSPTYLPIGYQVKLIKVSKGLSLVTIFVSKYSLTDKTTSTQFFYLDKGILITYYIASKDALDNSKWTLFTPQANKITIDGNEAVIENIRKLNYHGQPYDMWADLAMFKGNMAIGVRGFLSEDDLVKITTSMLEN
ncbi:MAG: hypothetical protein PXX83_07850, partial [Candidatus Nitrosotalea sp.]|nr:hypothetical protein [Candidatus Nitrosotalea sp.]